MDFLTKDLLKTFYFTTINNERMDYKELVVNGRTYYKFGKYQAVTMVGNLYKVYDPDVESFKYMLMVGVAKQHPRDLKITKKEGFEIANEKAYACPSIVIEVSSKFDVNAFYGLAENYIDTVMLPNLNFVKTGTEIMQCNIFEKISESKE